MKRNNAANNRDELSNCTAFLNSHMVDNIKTFKKTKFNSKEIETFRDFIWSFKPQCFVDVCLERRMKISAFKSTEEKFIT